MRPLQYVILHHEGIPNPHFDLMFETYPGSELATWRSPIWPIEQRVQLTRLRDHQWAFLNFEGELSGHRGRVHRIIGGTCELEVGESATWTIRVLTGTSPTTLRLKQIDDDRWDAEPC
jgi:hypothetical protein